MKSNWKHDCSVHQAGYTMSGTATWATFFGGDNCIRELNFSHEHTLWLVIQNSHLVTC
jgi:hypothetical protein